MKKDILKIINEEDPAVFRKFAFTIAAALLVISFILWFAGSGMVRYFGLAASVFALAGLTFPIFLKPFYLIWMALAQVLAAIMSRVILSLLFFLIFMPVGLIFRITGRDVLRLKLDPDAGSYWVKRARKSGGAGELKKQY